MNLVDTDTIDNFVSKWDKLVKQMSRRYTDDPITRLDFQQSGYQKLCVIWRVAEQNGAPKQKCEVCDAKAVIVLGSKKRCRCEEHLEHYVKASVSHGMKQLFKHGWNFNMQERDKRTNHKRDKADSNINGNESMHISYKQRVNQDLMNAPFALRRLIKEERVLSVMAQISPMAQAVLQQLQNPGTVAFELAENDYREAEARRKAGKLVMNLNRLKICKKHIAKQLEVSPATISRAIAEIQAADPNMKVN